MTTLLEDPMPVIFFGIIAEAVLAMIFVSTRQGLVAWVMLGVLVLVFTGVALERWVVTDVERVEATVDGAADALKDNNWPLLQRYLAEDATRTRSLAFSALNRVTFKSVKISSLRIEVNRLTSPPTAEAEFTGTTRFDSRDEMIRDEMIHLRYYAQEFRVELRLVNDRWLITDHIEYHEVR